MSSAGSVPRHALLGEPHAGASAPLDAESATSAPRLDLRTLFDQHYGSIFRLLRRLGVERAMLDDAAQEVFWVAARRLHDIRRGSEHSFLYGVALRVASNLLRKQRALPPMGDLDALDQLGATLPSPEEALEQRRARALLEAAISRLPIELRTVFVLFELEGLAVKEIAAMEDIPIGTASSRLRRARDEFSAIVRRFRAAMTHRGGIR